MVGLDSASHSISVGNQFCREFGLFLSLCFARRLLTQEVRIPRPLIPRKLEKFEYWWQCSERKSPNTSLVVGVERQFNSLRKLCHQFSPPISNSLFAHVSCNAQHQRCFRKSWSLIACHCENQFLQNSMQKVSSLSVELRENALVQYVEQCSLRMPPTQTMPEFRFQATF